MSVLPIEIQTVISQMANVSKIQHNQLVASTDLQRLEYLKDSKELKIKDERVDNANNVENPEVKEKEFGGSNSSNKDLSRNKNRTPVVPETEEELVKDDPNKGKIIDTLG